MYENKLIALPAAHIEAGNRIAHITDPDIGGSNTYKLNASPTGQAPANYALTSVPMTQATADLTDSKDPDQWFAALTQMAAARGRDAPIYQDCVDVCANIQIDGEVTVQLVVEDDAITD